jgi:predicted nucleic acid-binding protein
MATVRVALDTNILAYVEGVNGASRKAAATAMVAKLPAESTHVPVQVLGELFRVLVRKAKYKPASARLAIFNFLDIFPVIETSPSVLTAAADLSVGHGLDIWDAVILAAAASAGCRLLLSEDMQEGFTWNGVTVTNPFSAKQHELLAALLES